MNEAIILAGGLGTRLKDIIPDLPKPMAPVAGRPFMEYLLLWLSDNGIKKVVVSAGYKPGSIIDHFGNSFEGISLEYAIEDKPLGTGGAVRFAMNRISGKELLIINGDTSFPIDLVKFIRMHRLSKGLFSLALKRMMDFSRYGSVECRGDMVIRFNEKKYCSDGLINGGIYLAEKNLFDSGTFPEVFSLEKDLLEKEAGSGKLRCQVFDDPFIDIGIPEDYKKAQELFKNQSCRRNE